MRCLRGGCVTCMTGDRASRELVRLGKLKWWWCSPCHQYLDDNKPFPPWLRNNLIRDQCHARTRHERPSMKERELLDKKMHREWIILVCTVVVSYPQVLPPTISRYSSIHSLSGVVRTPSRALPAALRTVHGSAAAAVSIIVKINGK